MQRSISKSRERRKKEIVSFTAEMKLGWTESAEPPDFETVTSAKCNLEDVHPLQNVCASHSTGDLEKLS